jgi:hypothetical protein
VDRDSRLRRRLLRQFDRGVATLQELLEAHFGDWGFDAVVAETRTEYEAVIDRLPWIGGSANPRSFSLYGSALWLALWRVLEPRGLTLDEARDLFSEMFRTYWSRYPRVFRHLYGRIRMGPTNQKKVRRLALASQQRTNPNDYVSRFVPGEPSRFDFGIDFVECAIIKFLRAEGAEELATVLCELDWPHTELIGIELMRTTTLAQGGERCDFRFRRPGAPDVGIPRASVAALIAHGFVGWAACGLLMGGLLATVSTPTAVMAHAVGAPIIFAAVTAHLFLRSGGRPPIVVAATFTAMVVALDALIVAWLIQQSFAMFSSALGTWVPFALIFVSVFVTGSLLWRGRSSHRASAPPRRTHPG